MQVRELEIPDLWCDKGRSPEGNKAKRALERIWKGRKRVKEVNEADHKGFLSVCVWVCVCAHMSEGSPANLWPQHKFISCNSEQSAGCDLAVAWALALPFVA